MKKVRYTGSWFRFSSLMYRYLLVLLSFILLSMTILNNSVRILCWVCFFVMSAFTFIYTLPLIFIQFKRKYPSKMIKKAQRYGFIQLEDLPIYYKDLTVSKIECIKNVYFSLDEEQKKAFNEYGFIFVIGSYKDLTTYIGDRPVTGLFDKTKKVIYIYTEVKNKENEICIPTYENLCRTIYHEWGHFLDYLNNFPSYTPFFRNKFKEESDLYFNSIRALEKDSSFGKIKNVVPYEYTSVSEFFAVNYSDFCMLKKIDTDIFIYLKNL